MNAGLDVSMIPYDSAFFTSTLIARKRWSRTSWPVEAARHVLVACAWSFGATVCRRLESSGRCGYERPRARAQGRRSCRSRCSRTAIMLPLKKQADPGRARATSCSMQMGLAGRSATAGDLLGAWAASSPSSGASGRDWLKVRFTANWYSRYPRQGEEGAPSSSSPGTGGCLRRTAQPTRGARVVSRPSWSYGPGQRQTGRGLVFAAGRLPITNLVKKSRSWLASLAFRAQARPRRRRCPVRPGPPRASCR